MGRFSLVFGVLAIGLAATGCVTAEPHDRRGRDFDRGQNFDFRHDNRRDNWDRDGDRRRDFNGRHDNRRDDDRRGADRRRDNDWREREREQQRAQQQRERELERDRERAQAREEQRERERAQAREEQRARERDRDRQPSREPSRSGSGRAMDSLMQSRFPPAPRGQEYRIHGDTIVLQDRNSGRVLQELGKASSMQQ